ncbi:amino acid permease [Escherichia coli]
MGQSSQPHELGGGLKSRHVTMLSIAGVIGASLFVSSSVAIAEAGPAVLLAYLFAGLLVVMIMRMLAEMAVATPDTGSFSTYADKAIGRWAGYTIGWLYWWFWVLVIPAGSEHRRYDPALVGSRHFPSGYFPSSLPSP